MKILLTNSPFQYYMTTSFFHPDWGALNLPQLAAMVPNHEVKILDNWHHWFKQERILQTIKEFQPQVLAVSNSTAADTNRVLEMTLQIKRNYPKIIMIIGGQAATVRYKDCLNSGFSVVIRGEGEYTFQEVVDRINQGSKDFSDIQGVSYLKEGQFVNSPDRNFIENLDQLPFPRWELMPRFKSNFFPGIFASVIESSRGCPYTCDFCAVQSFWQRRYRKKSNERIIAELEVLKRRLGYDQVYFIDDSFALNVKEYTELFETMIRKKVTVKGFSQIRPDTVANNPDMIKLAARAGFWGFLVGFDSYDEQALSEVHKTGGTKINIKAAEILRKNEIGIFGVHMYGMPGTGYRNFNKTFNLGMENSDTFRMSRFSLIPGTPLYNELAEKNMVEARTGKYVPHSHKIKSEKRKSNMENVMYILYELRSLIGWKAIKKYITSAGIARTLQTRAYIVAIRYVFYLTYRKAGFEIL